MEPIAHSQTPLRAAQSGSRMRAVVYARYGSLDALRVKDIATPSIKDDEVLVRVEAAALHVGDVFGVRGDMLLMRLVTGLLRPRYGVPGFDLAGEVVALGRNVTRFKLGAAVFGSGVGTCAQYARAKAEHLALKPAGVSFEHAAALPTSALAALHGLRDAAKLKTSQKLLINGAAGGVGTFAVQLAKSWGAEVTGVCSTKNSALVRSLGADHVIDYSREDFTRVAQRYDVILDNVENRSLAECRRALAREGTLVLNSGTGARGLRMWIRLLEPIVRAPFARQKLRRYLSVPNHADLVELAQLVEAGVLKPVIDRICAPHETAAALGYIEGGHVCGKIVVSLRA